MPRLACWSCGRQVFSASPLDLLFVDERRCPRCGAFMNLDRREIDRREWNRRETGRGAAGPPAEAGERRTGDRRTGRRRRAG
jgi:ribosomal protein S27AE